MAKKKTAIGELIKSDMSRRSIGEEPVMTHSGELQALANAEPSLFESPANVHDESDVLAAFIAGQAKSAGLTDETDLRKFYDFLRGQAMRYIRGFGAGRRFHG